MSQEQKTATIVWTKIDEAPALATYSLLPIVREFTKGSGINIELRDISLAGRIIANFPDNLTEEQKQLDELSYLGELVKKPEANVLKLPNISASIPQLNAAIKELQSAGYKIPNYPADPKTDEEAALKKRFAKCLGSAVNPVLREGNSDRRAAVSVKKFGQKNPHRMMKPWPAVSKARIAHMNKGDFYETEKSVNIEAPTTAKIEFVSADDNSVTLLKDKIALIKDEIVDSSVMNVKELRAYIAEQIAAAKADDVLLSLHLKATMMKVSDPIMFGHAVSVYYEEALKKHADTLASIGFNPNNGLGHLYTCAEKLPADKRAELIADVEAVYKTQPALAMVDSSKGITNLHVPNNVIIDASVPNVVRDGGKMWNSNDQLQDTIALIPDRSYATMYQETILDCQKHGQFDPSTMGSVSNVGLMAKKAEEYGSHDKTFEASGKGVIRVVDSNSGAVLLEQNVEQGDIFRACQVKDEPVRDWVKLAVSRARATNTPALFWLDSARAHDAQLITKVNKYLADHDTTGLDIRILAPVEAMRFSLERIRRGEDTISVTGNVLRDYLTDLFPILELGTSARMLSIVPLLNGGGLFETGAGGSAPKHVEQFLNEGHLRWDSLGEFCALVASFEHVATTLNSSKAAVMSQTLDQAIGKHLENQKSPSRKVKELGNGASHFYLALYWAQAIAEQTKDTELRDVFAPVARKLAENEEKIVAEYAANEGKPIDIGGYYLPSDEKCNAAMRPSTTFNSVLESIWTRSKM